MAEPKNQQPRTENIPLRASPEPSPKDSAVLADIAKKFAGMPESRGMQNVQEKALDNQPKR